MSETDLGLWAVPLAMLGGAITIVGTSTNLIVNSSTYSCSLDWAYCRSLAC